tara:strand:- start:72 stop:1337 length:1266 start_codon:yes stop_codon:yes gene_type:complete
MSELAEALKEKGYINLKIISGKRVAVISDDNRKDLLLKLAKEFGGKYNDDNRISSVGHVDLLDGSKILTKSKSGGQSGAGSAVTQLGESAQCVYAAALWYKNGDYSSKTLLEVAGKFTETDEQNDKIANKLSGDWQESSVAIANRMYVENGSKINGKSWKDQKFKFYRGKGVMSRIEEQFKKLNRIEKEFTNINKWTPADIWAATDKGKQLKFDKITSILEFNTLLLEQLKNGDLIGISLKKSETGNPLLNYKNVSSTRPTFKYKGYITNKGPTYFSAKDHYMKYDGGEIQFRTFAPTWQGEIKGIYANQGKLSGGPIGSIVKRITGKILTPQNKLSKGIDDDLFYKYYRAIKGGGLPKDKFKAQVALKNQDWKISKFLGAELLYHLITEKKEQSVINAMLGYASSQSQLSAPYVKISDEG